MLGNVPERGLDGEVYDLDLVAFPRHAHRQSGG
jgi:hypothetical protein